MSPRIHLQHFDIGQALHNGLHAPVLPPHVVFLQASLDATERKVGDKRDNEDRDSRHERPAKVVEEDNEADADHKGQAQHHRCLAGEKLHLDSVDLHEVDYLTKIELLLRERRNLETLVEYESGDCVSCLAACHACVVDDVLRDHV